MKKFITCFLSVFLFCVLTVDYVDAQKTSSSSGRSYSSGSSSSARSSFSGSSSTNRSSFSGVSSTRSSSSVVSPSGKSYSSSPKVSASSSVKVVTPSGKSYSSGNTPVQKSSNITTNNSQKPSNGGWNSGLSSANKKESSRQDYNKSKPIVYRTNTGEEKPINSSSPHVTTVRNITHERYITYDNRASIFYGGFYSHPVYYNDFYSPFLMGYMFSSAINANDRAYWIYCHQNDMDQIRYRDMLARDAELSARIRQLEIANTPRDTSYVLPTMTDNPDLQYNKEFVDSTYQSNHSVLGTICFWFFIVILIGAVIITGIYFVFVREYK